MVPTAKTLLWKSQFLQLRRSPVTVNTLRYRFKAPFTVFSNAFYAQELSNLARKDLFRLSKTLPLVSFFFGSLVGAAYTLPWWWRQQGTVKRLQTSAKPHVATIQKTVMNFKTHWILTMLIFDIRAKIKRGEKIHHRYFNSLVFVVAGGPSKMRSFLSL
jgi:hypothetical protein